MQTPESKFHILAHGPFNADVLGITGKTPTDLLLCSFWGLILGFIYKDFAVFGWMIDGIRLKENRAQTSSQRQLGKLWVCATLKVSSLVPTMSTSWIGKWCARDLKDITQPGEKEIPCSSGEWAGWTNASGGLWVWAAVFPWFLKTYCWEHLKRETLSNNNTFLASI